MINIALFGLGRIGVMHAQNIYLNNNCSLQYVFDIDQVLAKKIAKKFNSISIKNTRIAYTDKNVDVIFITTPTSTHIKYIMEAVKFKKTIFCEKPLDLNIKKINQCKKFIKKYNPKIQVGFNRRYDPGHYALKKSIQIGEIGKLEKIIITSRDPAPPSMAYLKVSGGIFRDMTIHDFDLIRFYLGNDEVKEIFATTTNLSDLRIKKINDYELAMCLIKSEKGVICMINNSRHCSYGYDQRVEVFGSKGMVISGNRRDNASEKFLGSKTAIKRPLLNFFIDRYEKAYQLQLDDLVYLVQKRKNPRASFEEGRKAIIIANAAYKSLKFNKVVKINF
ncbi:MAG: inositol 2-dehydrogenase [Pelagibacterales bacterium]|jgi:myo-inositol 2-dehydrogenase/D-chiro-inositol 1-dehydrogenase|nr:inositol 2-dehydrogenase [Pelagibacterales bacterium]